MVAIYLITWAIIYLPIGILFAIASELKILSFLISWFHPALGKIKDKYIVTEEIIEEY